MVKKVTKIKMKVEAATRKGFVAVAECVELEFPQGIGTYPMPKQEYTEKAFREQHPELCKNLPCYKDGLIEREYGLCFTRIE
jgi:hypothetical protein